MAPADSASSQTSRTMNSTASFSTFSIRSILNLQEDLLDDQRKSPFTLAHVTNISSPCYPLVPRSQRTRFPHLSRSALGLQYPVVNASFVDPVAKFPFPSHGFSSGIELLQRKRRGLLRKKKERPLFSTNQIQTMEKEFTKCRYVTQSRRSELALELNMTETQVKTWFQNRRTKWKKENKEKGEKPSLERQSNSCDDAMWQTLCERNMKCHNLQHQMFRMW